MGHGLMGQTGHANDALTMIMSPTVHNQLEISAQYVMTITINTVNILNTFCVYILV